MAYRRACKCVHRIEASLARTSRTSTNHSRFRDRHRMNPIYRSCRLIWRWIVNQWSLYQTIKSLKPEWSRCMQSRHRWCAPGSLSPTHPQTLAAMHCVRMIIIRTGDSSFNVLLLVLNGVFDFHLASAAKSRRDLQAPRTVSPAFSHINTCLRPNPVVDFRKLWQH